MCSVTQSCPTLCDAMDCDPPGSSVHGILQARILEWAAMPSSTGSSWPRDWTLVSGISYIGRQILYHLSYLESLEKQACPGRRSQQRHQKHDWEDQAPWKLLLVQVSQCSKNTALEESQTVLSAQLEKCVLPSPPIAPPERSGFSEHPSWLRSNRTVSEKQSLAEKEISIQEEFGKPSLLFALLKHIIIQKRLHS